MDFLDGFVFELHEILEDDFTGKITLHCLRGQVQKYEVNQTRKPRKFGVSDGVDLTESNGKG